MNVTPNVFCGFGVVKFLANPLAPLTAPITRPITRTVSKVTGKTAAGILTAPLTPPGLTPTIPTPVIRPAEKLASKIVGKRLAAIASAPLKPGIIPGWHGVTEPIKQAVSAIKGKTAAAEPVILPAPKQKLQTAVIYHDTEQKAAGAGIGTVITIVALGAGAFLLLR